MRRLSPMVSSLLVGCASVSPEAAPSVKPPSDVTSSVMPPPAPAASPPAPWSCPSLQDVLPAAPSEPDSPGDSAKALARARAVLAAREADILKCDGVERVTLARTNTNAPALVVWLKEDAPRVSDDWSTTPRSWVAEVPFLTWRHTDVCLLNARATTRVVRFASGKTVMDSNQVADLTRFVSEIAAYPEFDQWYVHGLDATIGKEPPAPSHPGVPAALQRAKLVAAWLSSHSFSVKDTSWNNWPAETDGVLLSGYVRNQCGADHVWFR